MNKKLEYFTEKRENGSLCNLEVDERAVTFSADQKNMCASRKFDIIQNL